MGINAEQIEKGGGSERDQEDNTRKSKTSVVELHCTVLHCSSLYGTTLRCTVRNV